MESAHAAGVAIFDVDGRLLLGRHAHDGCWATIGGRVELGESAEQAARREVREEIGLDLDIVHPLGSFGGTEIYEIEYPNGDRVAFDVSMFVAMDVDDSPEPDRGEILELSWFADEDLVGAKLAPDMAEIVPAAFEWFAGHRAT